MLSIQRSNTYNNWFKSQNVTTSLNLGGNKCKGLLPPRLINPKGNQSWIFTGRTDAEAPILWPPDAKSQLTGKDPDAGEDWWQKEKWTAEDEITDSMNTSLSKLGRY